MEILDLKIIIKIKNSTCQIQSERRLVASMAHQQKTSTPKHRQPEMGGKHGKRSERHTEYCGSSKVCSIAISKG